MAKESNTKKDFPSILDIMFGNKSAARRSKRIKGFQLRKPDKYYKPGFKKRK